MSLAHTVAPGDLLWTQALYEGIQAAKAGTLDLSAAFQQFAYLILPEVTVPGAHGDTIGYGAFKIDNFGNVTWPGGTQDPGEVPTNHIIQISLSKIVNGVPTGESLLFWDPTDITFKSLFTAASLQQMEMRLFKGDDIIFSVPAIRDATDDVLHGWDGNDEINSLNSGGRDALYGDDGNDRLSVYDGATSVPLAGDRTTMFGGAGNDTLNGDEGKERLFGGAGDDVFGQLGKGGDDVLYGGAGNDQLSTGDGDSILEGGTGNDTIWGGRDTDSATGGGGADTFVFVYIEAISSYDSGVRQTRRDVVTDFVSGLDHLRIVHLVLGAGPPEVLASGPFTAANQVRWVSSGGTTTVFVNTDADLKAEMAITLQGTASLQATDFI